MDKRTRIRRQRGLTLVEVSIVMILAALVATAAVFGFQSNQRRNEVRENTELIIETAAEIQRKFGVHNQYGAITTEIAVRSRTIPQHLRATATTARNSYGGAITVTPATLAIANDAAALTWESVPASQCADLIVGAQSAARRIQIGATEIKAIGAAAINYANLATACDATGTASIVFVIGRTPGA